MANSLAFHRSATLLALIGIFISVAAFHVANAQGQNPCPSFSCGGLHNISSPFRRPGDPPECGVKAYELLCSSSKATIRISTGTYFVTSINYTDKSFWVVDANLDVHCPLPRSDQLPYGSYLDLGSHYHAELDPATFDWACFVNCSQAVPNTSSYMPVTCLSTNSSFVYVSMSSGYCQVDSLDLSCGYLATIPLGSFHFSDPQLENASYATTSFRKKSYSEIIELVKKGFSVSFPYDGNLYTNNFVSTPRLMSDLKSCLKDTNKSFFHEHIYGASPLNWSIAFFGSEMYFAQCMHNLSPYEGGEVKLYCFGSEMYFAQCMHNLSPYEVGEVKLYWVVEVIAYAIGVTKLYIGLCRLVLFPLAIFTFLARKYWKTRISIDVVEKFLQMQQMLGPKRYAYTDIIAITSHLKDKLGQGGYGSVYKGVLHPGNVHVAIKMFGSSNCNGDDFISEISTIGRIHHINVVRLVGYCAEEMRRALVYEYMPHGSLDKYIFSSERSFSWDKLNEIALGIASGINYLHQGCDMQILHFDIKPHNILLDSNFVPKVADFGLAKLYPRDKSFVPASALRGTIGYIAPEMISRSFGLISSKSDVYSFGMLLLEMAGGRRNADQNAGSSSQAYYPSWVFDRLAEQEVGEISSAADMHELERKLCIVGLRCIQMKPDDRPTMGEVIEMLECGVGGLQMPSRLFFCDDEHIAVADSYHFSSELTIISEEDE